MNEAIPYILLGWLGLSVLLFRWIEPLKAGLVCALGGWALLPSAAFEDLASYGELPLWLAGSALPSEYFLTKASVIGAGLWGGILVYGSQRLRAWRPRRRDAPLAVFCAAPLLAGWVNGLPWLHGFQHALYLAVVWGGSYMLGRLFLIEPHHWRQLALAVLLGGLVFVPPGLAEWVFGPIWYEWLYGFHPFQLDGHIRYIGFRPLGLLEHGNQAGMWMASAALVGVWVHRSKGVGRIWGLSTRSVAAVLAGATLLFQSVGSIILLGAGWSGLVWVAGASLAKMRRAILLCGLLFTLLGVMHVSNLVSLENMKGTALGSATGEILKEIGRGSLAWRIKLDQKNLVTIMEKPILGWGKEDWWKENYHVRPWGLWLMVWGMYGLVGLVALALLFLWPLGSLLRLRQSDRWRRREWCFVSGLGVVLLINAFDALLNSMFIVPFIAIAGGLTNLVLEGGLADEEAQGDDPPEGQVAGS